MPGACIDYSYVNFILFGVLCPLCQPLLVVQLKKTALAVGDDRLLRFYIRVDLL